jgi:hypothetical protein
MDLVVANSVIAAIAFTATAVAAYLFYRQLPRRHNFLPVRNEDVDIWRNRVSSEQMALTKAVLETVCDAFPFDRSDAWRFRPDDKLRTIYESFYPRGLGLPDGFEYESLFDELYAKFRVPKHSISELWATEPTLADIVDCCLRHSRHFALTGPSGDHSDRSDLGH